MAENPAFYLHMMQRYITTVAEDDKIKLIKALNLIVRADPGFPVLFVEFHLFRVIIEDLLQYISSDINTFQYQHVSAMDEFIVLNNFIRGVGFM